MELKIINIGHLFEPLLEEIKKRTGAPEIQITNLPTLNDMIWGVRKRKLTIIGARPSHGKSAFAVQICLDIVKQNKSVIFFSLEMENLECAERLIAYELKIHNKTIQRGDISNDYNRINQFAESIKSKKFFISDCIGRTWQQIADVIEKLRKIDKVPDVIVLDYIQNTKGEGNAKEAMDEYIRKFREMAIRYNFAGILCSQINRASQDGEEKAPMLHQLKGSGFIEEHADIVLLLHWPYKYDCSKDKYHFEINVAKNKLGDTGWINVKYEPEFFKFSEPIIESIKY